MTIRLFFSLMVLSSAAWADSPVIIEAPVVVIEEPGIVIEEPTPDPDFPRVVREIKGEFDPGEIGVVATFGGSTVTSGYYTPEGADEISSTRAYQVEFQQNDKKLYFAVISYLDTPDGFSTNITNFDQAQQACQTLGEGWELIRSDDMFGLAFTGIARALQDDLVTLNLGPDAGVVIIDPVDIVEPEPIDEPLVIIDSEDSLFEEPDYNDLNNMYDSFTPFWFVNEEGDYTKEKLAGTDTFQLFRHSGWDPSPIVSLSEFQAELSDSEKNDPGSLRSAYHRVAQYQLDQAGVPAICSNGSMQ